MKHSFARGGFGNAGLVASLAVVATAVIVVWLVNSRTKPTVIKPVPSDDLRTRALLGDVDAAAKLATLGKDACPAMLEVLEQVNLSDKQVEEEMKIALLQGLGANKYFDAVPALIRILEADDDSVALRHQAYIALTGVFGNVTLPRDPAERKDRLKEMLGEWKGRKNILEAKTATQGK